jgi:hypothetical protein
LIELVGCGLFFHVWYEKRAQDQTPTPIIIFPQIACRHSSIEVSFEVVGEIDRALIHRGVKIRPLFVISGTHAHGPESTFHL